MRSGRPCPGGKRIRFFLFALVGWVVLACVSSRAAVELQWEAIGERIALQLSLRPGEKVLLALKGDRFFRLVPPLSQAIQRRGGVFLGAFQASAPGLTPAGCLALLETVDAMVILPGALPSDPLYAAAQMKLQQGRGRTVHFHWAGAVPLPGHAPPAADLVARTYQKAVLETDYKTLSALQKRFAEALDRASVHITTPEGTDLTFRTGGRPVTLQNGDASAERAKRARVLIEREIELPAGAIRVAPIEETVTGKIVFPPSVWGGEVVEGLEFFLEAGRIVRIEAARGREAVVRELDEAGPGARSFREFALGLNPLLAVGKERSWIPYYGYGAGVVRLSLGNNQELGGAVGGNYVRWNFFIDATLTLRDRIWVRDGRLEPPP